MQFFPGLSRSLAHAFRLEGLKIAYYNLTTVNDVFTKLKYKDTKEKTPGVVYTIQSIAGVANLRLASHIQH